jgi:hypothetical protein
VGGGLPRYVACPGQNGGLPRVITAIIVGVPTGVGLSVITVVGLLLAYQTQPWVALRPTIRRTTERAAFGAIFGTLLAAAASTVGLHQDTGRCHVDLLQTIGNGATWGTLVGFASAFWLLFATLTKVASATHPRPQPAPPPWPWTSTRCRSCGSHRARLLEQRGRRRET